MTTTLRRALTILLAAASLLATIGAGRAAGETLVAAGDIANPPGGGRGDVATARVVQANRPTLVLALGDTQYEHGEYRNFLAAYDRSWGRFKARTRPAVGNHEYMDPAGPAAGYFRYFGRQAGDPRRGYYSFDVGPWHAVALNSACGQAGAPSCGHGSPQWSWLRRDLASHRQRCTVAFFHHPFRSSAAPFTGKPELKHLWALLVAGGVDVVLNGHNHAYERLKPMRTMGDVDHRGAPWTIVAGTGGRSLIPYTSVHRNSVYRAMRYGIYKMVLYPDRWVGGHKGTDGVTRDLHSIGCH
ncbi:MAG TPA: metallophosphoesterase [Actinophytocola sp.]|uniref:metallophosphoesterase family protein n=1 Tax=Actinophytocola sp. TaxID=1872138 RepID=UPI002E07D855|nr:metallophosphoesterase [Actinophytocola sp.]